MQIEGDSEARKPKAQGTVRNSLWRTAMIMILPSLLLLGVFYFYPLIRLLPQSIYEDGFTMRNFKRFFSEPLYTGTLLRTLKVCAVVTLVNVLVGYPVAYVLSIARPRVARVLMILVIVPFWMSLLVRTYSWMVILQRNGIINRLLMAIGLVESPLKFMYTEFAVSMGMTHILLPFMILPVYSVLAGVDPNLALAAATMGATPWKAFFRVTLPLSMPGVAAGVLLVFVQSLGFYVTPMLLGGPQTLMISSLIDRQMFRLLNWPFGAAISLILLTLALVFMIGFDKVFGLDTIQEKMI